MKTLLVILMVIISGFTILSCNCESSKGYGNIHTVDKNSNPQVKKLFSNIKRYQDSVIIFGSEEGFVSKNIFGDYPGVFAWNFSKNFLSNAEMYKSQIIKAYSLGAVVMLDFSDFFNSEGYDKVVTSYSKLNGFLRGLEYGGNQIPLVLKFFPRQNVSGYWWSMGELSESGYIRLWHDGVRILSDSLGLHNLLYVYSPCAGNGNIPYLYGFPGKEYVDIMGMEVYFSSKDIIQYAKFLAIKTDTLVNTAIAMNKPSAITGTSLKSANMSSWLCSTIVPALKQYDNRKVAWVTLMNGTTAKGDITEDSTLNFVEDLKKFKASDLTVFLGDMPNMYND